MAKKKLTPAPQKPSAKERTRGYISQSDVPNCGLSSALRVSEAIVENYGCKPATPLEVAEALDMTPTSGTFRNLCGASMAYGLTEGGYNASQISVTQLADRIFKPQEEGDDHAAMCEAFLSPRIVREFLQKYNGNQLPKVDIAKNVLEKMGVPTSRTDDVHDMILTEASKLGMIHEIKGKRFVQLESVKPQSKIEGHDATPNDDEEVNPLHSYDAVQETTPPIVQPPVLPSQTSAEASNRVFVGGVQVARMKGPKKTNRYPDEFKIKAVQLADHPDILAKDVAG